RMSASPLKADNLHTISASPLSAKSGCEQSQRDRPLSMASSRLRASSTDFAVATLMTSSNFDGSSFIIFALKRIIQYLVDSRVEGIVRTAAIAAINRNRNAAMNITFVTPLPKSDVSLLSDQVTFPA